MAKCGLQHCDRVATRAMLLFGRSYANNFQTVLKRGILQSEMAKNKKAAFEKRLQQ